jgi:tripartite-type tricarboxylate transporter receptor subunit TctC
MQNRFVAALALLVAACGTNAVLAQPYPAKPVRIVVGYTPGGSNDVLARVVAKHLQDTWKQSFVVENKPGASGQIGAETGAKAVPDGYTLVVIPNDVLTVQPHMYAKFPFDPIADVQPIATLGTVPIALVVNANSPIKSVAELVATAKAKPGVLNYASSGAGGPQHMSAEMFMLLTGTKMAHVPYKGNAPALTDLLGGQVDVLFSPINSALPHIKAGKLRALAVASDARLSSLPDVSTLSEAGVPGYKSEIWIGLFAPAKTPRDVVDKIAAEVGRMQAQADVREQLNAQGIEPLPNSPEQLAALIKADSARWSKVIKETGLKAE